MMDYRIIKSTNGRDIFVDVEDFLELEQYDWYAWGHKQTFYAVRSKMIKGIKQKFYMHKIIMLKHSGNANGREIDHGNHNGLDNRKSNLAYCTRRKNAENRIDNTTGYSGVYSQKGTGKWTAQVWLTGKLRYLGTFLTKEDAHNAAIDFRKLHDLG